ncbi:hypothetical protein [Pseudomonas psychrophila]|uniref:Uncharacterized protein n=1 Tax=Pseudomonas psychrophila TaxID=122355 RepID=A0A8I1FXW8_9PSED|nr:hypothetical protein [Pseudomonas psychrophila]AVX93354.1 hypothetical protein PkP19E3_35270 [Pseudomonas koreensis]MBJ2259690.1 hypothetical protein [Pseudomonas psychrophila]
MNNTKPTVIALLRNTAQIYVGQSRFSDKPVFLVEAKNENHVYELRGDATTDDHYASLAAEFGDIISKPGPDAQLNSIEFNTGRQYSPEGQHVEAWVLAIDHSIPELPLKVVYFKDRSRMIDGLVRVRSLTEREVMEEYDHGRYDPA